MTKFIRSYIALMAGSLLLFSCAKDEAQEGSLPVPIKLTAASLGTDTRAADGINNTNFPFETPITVAVDGTNYGYKTDATSVSDPMVCQETASPYFPVNGSSVHIVAYHPASMQYATADQTFTVAADQSTAAGYIASDLMVGLPQMSFEDGSGNSLIEGSGMTRKVKRTSIPIPLEFEHKLSKIKVNVNINGAVVKSVTMKNIMRSVDFNPSTAALSNVTPVATTGLDNVIMFSDFTGTSTNFVTAAIIPEQDPTTGTEFIDVVIQDSPSDKTLTYKLQEDGNFESGKQYVYNLTVSNDEILCTTSITNWDDVTLTPAQQGDGLAVLDAIKKNPLWYVAEGFMTNSATGSSATLTMGTGNTGYFYTWANAMQTFAAQNAQYSDYKTAGKTISGKDGTWHMPVKGEVLSLLPYESNMFALDSDVNDIYSTDNVIFGYNSETKTGITDNFYWKNMGSSKGRAIRFLNSEYCSAWEYEMNTTTSPNTLTITSCLIGWVDNTKSAASAAYNEIDWANLSSYGTAVQRVYCARGYKDYGTSSIADCYNTTCVAYWSTTYSMTGSGGWGDGSWGFECFNYTGYGLWTCKSLRQSAGMNVCMFRDN